MDLCIKPKIELPREALQLYFGFKKEQTLVCSFLFEV
jgi:hypothetical protein